MCVYVDIDLSIDLSIVEGLRKRLVSKKQDRLVQYSFLLCPPILQRGLDYWLEGQK